MNRRNMWILTLILTIVSATAPVGMAKAEGNNSMPVSKVIYAPINSEQSIRTNQLKPYVLSEKEVQTIFGNFFDEIEKFRLQSGYYVFDNEKYGIKDANVYVMISLGQRNTTGYGINIVSAEDIEGTAKITIKERIPKSGMMVGEALTYPYLIVKLPQGTSNVKVVTDSGRKMSSQVDSSELKAKEWRNLKSWENVAEDKQWLITFKNDISKEDINSDVIYVRDGNGKKVPTQLITREDKRTVTVIPMEKYAAGESYYLFISGKVGSQEAIQNEGNMYRMNFNIKGAAPVDSLKQEANAYIVSSEFKNVPIFDGDTDKQVGTVSEGFSINLTGARGDRVYFSVPVVAPSQPNKKSSKEYYVSAKYLEKAYKEPFITLMIISTDMIKIKENTSIYTIDNGVKESVMKTSKNIGPLHYIYKSENGYQFVLGNNLVYVNPEDVELIKN